MVNLSLFLSQYVCQSSSPVSIHGYCHPSLYPSPSVSHFLGSDFKTSISYLSEKPSESESNPPRASVHTSGSVPLNSSSISKKLSSSLFCSCELPIPSLSESRVSRGSNGRSSSIFETLSPSISSSLRSSVPSPSISKNLEESRGYLSTNKGASDELSLVTSPVLVNFFL